MSLKPIVSRETARTIADFLQDKLPDGYVWVLLLSDNSQPVAKTTTLASLGATQQRVAAFIRDQADQMDRGEQPEFPP